MGMEFHKHIWKTKEGLSTVPASGEDFLPTLISGPVQNDSLVTHFSHMDTVHMMGR